MDFYSDNGALLQRKLKGTAIPDYIKNAVYLTREKQASLEDTDFAYADGGKRYFPIVDAGNTAISTIYFLEKRAEIPKEDRPGIAMALVDACRQFGIEPPDILIQEAQGEPVNPIEKKASVKTLDDRDIVRAAATFEDMYRTYDPPTRRKTALDIVKAASAYGIDSGSIPVVVRIYAGSSWNPELPAHLAVREQLLKEAGSKFAQVIPHLMEAALSSDVDPERFAEELFLLDKEAGLLHLYDERLPDAFICTLAPDEPEDTTGKEVEGVLMKYASSEHAHERFDDEFLELVQQSPFMALAGVSPEDRDLFISCCEEYLRSQG